MAIKTSANVPMKGGKTGGYNIQGQGKCSPCSGKINTTGGAYGKSPSAGFHASQGGNHRNSSKKVIKTTSGY